MKKLPLSTYTLPIVVALSILLLFGCDSLNDPLSQIKYPTIEGPQVTWLSDSKAEIKVQVSSTGGANISTYGVYLNEGKILAYNLASDLSFSLVLENLQAETTYQVKAFSTNLAGEGQSAVLSFTTLKKEELPANFFELKLKTLAVQELGYHSALLRAQILDAADLEGIDLNFLYWSSHTQNFKSVPVEKRESSGPNLNLSTLVNGLASVSEYGYRLKASNEKGDQLFSSTLYFFTKVFTLNLNTLAATEVSYNSALLRAQVLNAADLEGIEFSFEYRLANSSVKKSVPAQIIENTGTSLTFNALVEELAGNSDYSYCLKATYAQQEILYSPELTFTTLVPPTPPFTIPEASLFDITSDDKGNVYVLGSWWLGEGEERKLNALAAKFNQQGELLWRTDIISEHLSQTAGGIALKDGVLYAHMKRDATYLIGDGKVYVDAYDTDSGALLWSTQVSQGVGADLAVSPDNHIYSAAYKFLTKLNSAGEIVAQYQCPGLFGFRSISVYNNNQIMVGGAEIIEAKYQSKIWAFDENLNMLWEHNGIFHKEISNITSLASLPESNLLISGELGSFLAGLFPVEAFVVCYEVKENGLELQWKKFFKQSLNMRVCRYENNFYAHTSDYNNLYEFEAEGPSLMDTAGNILWEANPKRNGYITRYADKLYLSNGSEQIIVIPL